MSLSGRRKYNKKGNGRQSFRFWEPSQILNPLIDLNPPVQPQYVVIALFLSYFLH